MDWNNSLTHILRGRTRDLLDLHGNEEAHTGSWEYYEAFVWSHCGYNLDGHHYSTKQTIHEFCGLCLDVQDHFLRLRFACARARPADQ